MTRKRKGRGECLKPVDSGKIWLRTRRQEDCFKERVRSPDDAEGWVMPIEEKICAHRLIDLDTRKLLYESNESIFLCFLFNWYDL